MRGYCKLKEKALDWTLEKVMELSSDRLQNAPADVRIRN
jgi:hypothetical protein